MNRFSLIYAVLLTLCVAVSCSQGDSAPPQNAGSSGTPAQGGGMLTGGTSATGATAPTGGTTGASGGTTTGGSGATTSTGGSTAGGSTQGGASGTGGSMGGSSGGTMGTGGSGGTPAGGTPAGGSGGDPAGGTPAGGAPMGGQPSGGMSGGTNGGGGTTGGMAAGGMVNVAPDFDGFYWESTCVGTRSTSGKNCPLDDQGATCPNAGSWDQRGTIRNETMKLQGTPGTVYTINFEVRGVAGTRCYTGGTPASTATPSPSGANNTWYVGGQQANDSIWNTYELHVEDPPVSGEANTYYLNAFPANPDWCQKEATYQIGYTASFKVMGDSTLRFTIHDTNCQAQQNCGSNEGSNTCDDPRTVDLSGMSPAATFSQPPTNVIGASTYRPQWLYFDVKTITSP